MFLALLLIHLIIYIIKITYVIIENFNTDNTIIYSAASTKRNLSNVLDCDITPLEIMKSCFL